MEIHLKIIGFLLIFLSIIHAFFPKHFDWKNEFKNVSLINRQMMYIHTLFIGIVIFLIGFLCVTSSNDLINTNFGHKISLGLGVFWGIRLFVQFFGYSSKLWKGNKFETFMHILFSIFWFYITYVFISISLK